jgi:hypothetical protein
MMISKKMMKEMPKCDGMAIPDDPRIGIGLNTVPEPDGFKQKVRFKDFYPPEAVATTSTATDNKFGQIDDHVPVRFNPHFIGPTPEMSASRRFDEETGLIESKTVEKQLFLDLTMVETAFGNTVVVWVISDQQWQHQMLSIHLLRMVIVSLVIRTILVLTLGVV